LVKRINLKDLLYWPLCR